MTTTADTATSVMEYAMTIRNRMMEPGHQSITFMDFEPSDTTGFVAIFAAKFGCPEKSEGIVRNALDELEQMGAIYIERAPQGETRSGSKGKFYPASVRVTVELR